MACGPNDDFKPRKGLWHCCVCHRTFKRGLKQKICLCGSTDIFDTTDNGWKIAEEDAKERERREEVRRDDY